MSFGGRLETLDLSALLQTLSVGVASGRLTLTRLDRHAVVLRGGRLVYASGAVRRRDPRQPPPPREAGRRGRPT